MSTREQNPARQTDALEGRVDVVVVDKASGASKDRPGLQRILTEARPGDRLVCTSPDRLARSVRDLLDILDGLTDRGVVVDVGGLPPTDSEYGRLVISILGSVAEMELALIHRRQAEGIEAARARGVHMGRPKALSPEQEAAMLVMRGEGASYRKLAKAFDVSVRTAHRIVTEAA